MTNATRVSALILMALLTGACGPIGPSAQVTPQAPVPSPTSDPTPLPTPAPTPVPTPVPSPVPSPSAGATVPHLIVHLTPCGHECGPTPGTTIMSDGRIIWPGKLGQPREARLTSAGLERVRNELDGIEALRTSADFNPKLRPGADPPGHGVGTYRFDLDRGGQPVVVRSGDPGSYEPEFWIISPEMKTLGALADQLLHPVAWLGPGSFSEPAHAYAADRYLLLLIVSLFGGIPPLIETDADDVDWPMAGPIDQAGEQVDIGLENQQARCLILDARSFEQLVAAESAAGAIRDLTGWISSLDYRWVRGNGSVFVQTTPLLPHESGSCIELLTTPRF